MARLKGTAGSTVSLKFLDGADREVSMDLDRAAPRGKIVRMGNLPPVPVWSEWRRLPQNVGLLRFNIFLDPEGLAKTMEEAIKGCSDCQGVVIALRGNPLEGIGAIPDEEVRVTRRQLLEGRDPPLDAAVAWIQRQKPGGTSR